MRWPAFLLPILALGCGDSPSSHSLPGSSGARLHSVAAERLGRLLSAAEELAQNPSLYPRRLRSRLAPGFDGGLKLCSESEREFEGEGFRCTLRCDPGGTRLTSDCVASGDARLRCGDEQGLLAGRLVVTTDVSEIRMARDGTYTGSERLRVSFDGLVRGAKGDERVRCQYGKSMAMALSGPPQVDCSGLRCDFDGRSVGCEDLAAAFATGSCGR
jgi:hypothetical protein